LINNYTNCF